MVFALGLAMVMVVPVIMFPAIQATTTTVGLAVEFLGGRWSEEKERAWIPFLLAVVGAVMVIAAMFLPLDFIVAFSGAIGVGSSAYLLPAIFTLKIRWKEDTSRQRAPWFSVIALILISVTLIFASVPVSITR